MTEQWRDVIGFEGQYKVSSEGRVKRIATTITAHCLASPTGQVNRKRPDIILKPFFFKADSSFLVILVTRTGKRSRFSVDRLVISAFKGPQPRCKVLHVDGDVNNNRLDNLVWKKVHTKDGLNSKGLLPSKPDGKYRKRLTEPEIKSIYCSSDDIKQVAKAYRVSPLTVRLIRLGVWWEDITKHCRNSN